VDWFAGLYRWPAFSFLSRHLGACVSVAFLSRVVWRLASVSAAAAGIGVDAFGFSVTCPSDTLSGFRKFSAFHAF